MKHSIPLQQSQATHQCGEDACANCALHNGCIYQPGRTMDTPLAYRYASTHLKIKLFSSLLPVILLLQGSHK